MLSARIFTRQQQVPTRSAGRQAKKGTQRRAFVANAATGDDGVGDDIAAPAEDPRKPFLERANALRARKIKEKLAVMNLQYKDLFDKSDLAERLADAWLSQASKAIAMPLRQLMGIPGNPRAGYVVVTLDMGDAGMVDFLIDTGATSALISPKMREMLGASAVEGEAVRGLGAMGETVRQKIKVDEVSIGSIMFNDFEAVVTDISAAGIPPVIGGLLGLDLLSKFEVEFNFTDKELRFWPTGSIQSGALDVDDLVEVPLETQPVGLKTCRVTLNGCAPFPAIVDMGSFFSVVNWMAAASAGVSPDSPDVKPAAMTAVGIDGQQMPMALGQFDLAVLGGGSGGGFFDDDPLGDIGGFDEEAVLKSDYRGTVTIGDIPAFASLGKETSPFMAMGLDVIGRGRTVFCAKDDKMYLTPGASADGGGGGP